MATKLYWAHNVLDTLDRFKAWHKPISDFILASGWTKAGDTGQLGGVSSWDSISLPALSGSIFEIFAMSDSLQSACPVYMKIYYMRGSASGARNSILIGTGTDGSGTLTGNATSSAYAGDNATSAYYQIALSAASNRFSIATKVNDATWFYTYSVERGKNVDGTDKDEFAYGLMASNGGTGQGAYAIAKPSSSWTVINTDYPCHIYRVSTMVVSGFPIVSPFFPCIGKIDNPVLGFVAAPKNDIAAAGSIITVPLYGTNHDFMVLQPGTLAQETTVNYCMRFE